MVKYPYQQGYTAGLRRGRTEQRQANEHAIVSLEKQRNQLLVSFWTVLVALVVVLAV